MRQLLKGEVEGKPLTEKDILQVLSKGTCLKSYALELSRSYNTKKTQMAIIFEKLNAGNYTHAVAIALRKRSID